MTPGTVKKTETKEKKGAKQMTSKCSFAIRKWVAGWRGEIEGRNGRLREAEQARARVVGEKDEDWGEGGGAGEGRRTEIVL